MAERELDVRRVNPFEVTGLIGGFLAGALVLTFGSAPSSIRGALPDPWVMVWATVLTLGSGLACLGLYWRRSMLTSMQFEQLGLLGSGGACAFYAVALAVFSYRENMETLAAAATAIMMILAFGIASLWQAGRIGRKLTLALQAIGGIR